MRAIIPKKVVSWHHWQEYNQDNGKKILSHNGYNLMHSWMGANIRSLRKRAFLVDGIPMMSIEQLIESKRRLARKKDLSDIALLEAYQRTHRTKTDAV